jgi:hypothetical protein
MPNLTFNQLNLNGLQANLSPELVTLFGRIKVATDATQWQIVQNTRLKDLLITEGQVSGSGTSSTYDENSASTLLTVGTAVGLRRLRSSVAGLYISGNAFLCLFTFNCEGNGQANVSKRGGYFSTKNGIFLRQINGVLSWVIRSSVSGSVVENAVIQSNWGDPNNQITVDKFDGSGSLGYTFDPTKCHIGWIAGEWLGVGDVYCGFVNDATTIIANIFRHPNLQAKPYMQTANLFLSYEIERTVAGGTSENFRAICATIKTEGDDSRNGFAQTVRMNAERVTNLADVFYILMTFQLNPNYINARVQIQNFEYSLTNNADTFYEFILIKNPTFSGGSYTPTWTSLPNSAIQYQVGFNNTLSVTAWEYLLKSSLASSGKDAFGNSSSNLSVARFLSSRFDDVSDIYCLAVKANSATVTIKQAILEFWEQI